MALHSEPVHEFDETELGMVGRLRRGGGRTSSPGVREARNSSTGQFVGGCAAAGGR